MVKTLPSCATLTAIAEDTVAPAGDTVASIVVNGSITEVPLDNAAVEAIIKTAATGKIGDSKIFLSKIDEAIRIRNQERGAAAI